MSKGRYFLLVFLFGFTIMLAGHLAEATTEDKLTASDAGAGDYFGYSVSLDGDTAIVGAAYNDDAGDDSGSAYVFTKAGSVWSEQVKLTASDIAVGDWFGHSVSISGDTAIVGACMDDHAGFNTGSAYVFMKTGSAWIQQAKLTAPDAAQGDHFGGSVSIDGDTAIVGAQFDDDVGLNSNSGSAYVFARTGSVWSQQAKLTATDAWIADGFGTSVDISGDTAIVGASGEDDGGPISNSGSAYVFTRTGSVWSQQAKLTVPNPVSYDSFGHSVGIAGDTAIVGAPGEDDGGSDSGSAYIFTRTDGTWSQQAKFTASEAAEGDQFGLSVSISGDTAIVGNSNDDDTGAQSGSAYVFARTGQVWSQLEKLTASDAATGDFFGVSVSISGDTAVVGAYLDDDGGDASGSAYVYDLSPSDVKDWSRY